MAKVGWDVTQHKAPCNRLHSAVCVKGLPEAEVARGLGERAILVSRTLMEGT